MDIKKICRLCFKTDIQNDFINMLKVPGLVDEISVVYTIEVKNSFIVINIKFLTYAIFVIDFRA